MYKNIYIFSNLLPFIGCNKALPFSPSCLLNYLNWDEDRGCFSYPSTADGAKLGCLVDHKLYLEKTAVGRERVDTYRKETWTSHGKSKSSYMATLVIFHNVKQALTRATVNALMYGAAAGRCLGTTPTSSPSWRMDLKIEERTFYSQLSLIFPCSASRLILAHPCSTLHTGSQLFYGTSWVLEQNQAQSQ